MKVTLPILAALMLVFVSGQAIAQSQADQEACEGDVFDLCSEQIPDQDEIVACLRKHWSKVSKQCRRVMINHKKNPKKRRESKNEPAAGNFEDY